MKLALGRRVYGLAAIVLALVTLHFGDFAGAWQPVPANLPYRMDFVYAAAALFAFAGAALQWPRIAFAAALTLAALYLGFASFWLWRVLHAPLVLSRWNGFAEQAALALAGLMLFATLWGRGLSHTLLPVCRLLFGLCALTFGAAHIVYPNETASFVPPWLPPSPHFWALITGLAQIGAGIAIATDLFAQLAARLLTLMYVAFALLVWAPLLVTAAEPHMVWAGNSMNFALVGAAWVVADALAARAAGLELGDIQ